jgi:hypothetical protein
MVARAGIWDQTFFRNAFAQGIIKMARMEIQNDRALLTIGKNFETYHS